MTPPGPATRFAPSPTGLMHLGNARTALFSYLYARRHGGRFVLRAEDTDPERSEDRYLEQACADLRWLGIAWDPGPDEHGVWRQSRRDAIYAGYYEKLVASAAAYPCFCTREELAASRRAQQAAHRPPRYPGTCAGLTAAEREARRSEGRAAALRFRVPGGEDVVFDDLVRGRQRVASGSLGDFVIRRADGTPAFFFCNALDDALMGITHVLRGEDHLANTPRQILLLRALNLPVPAYAHMALIVDERGAPLSKRQGATSIRALRSHGVLPAALTNYLVRLGHAYPAPEPGGLDTLAEGFDPGRLSHSPARHDSAQLRHWQKAAVEQLSAQAFMAWFTQAEATAAAIVPSPARAGFVAAVRANVMFPDDAAEWANRLYADAVLTDSAVAAIETAGSHFFAAALDALDGVETFGEFAARVREATGAAGKRLYQPLRAALTGATQGPEMAPLFALLGADRMRSRLAAARDAGNPTT